MHATDTLQERKNQFYVEPLDDTKSIGVHLPKKQGDVGWDLEAMEDVEIPAMQAVDVPVNARLRLPEGVWAEIRARSSIARRNLQVEAGTIDTGYRGPLYVLVRNMTFPLIHGTSVGCYNRIDCHGRTGELTAKIKAGERIGQLVFYHVQPMWMQQVEIGQIDTTVGRGEDGFGSTGR